MDKREPLTDSHRYDTDESGGRKEDGFVQLLRAYEAEEAQKKAAGLSGAAAQAEESARQDGQGYDTYLDEGYGEYKDDTYGSPSYGPAYEDVQNAWREAAEEEAENEDLYAPVPKKPRRRKLRPPKMVTFGILCLCVVLAAITGAVSSIAVMQHYGTGQESEEPVQFAEGTHGGMGAICSTILEVNQTQQADGGSRTVTADAGDASAVQQTSTDAGVIKGIMDSVVCIKTEVTVNTFYGPMSAGGAGSGVIISEDGYIVTCAHVIKDASKIEVQDSENNTYEATLIASSEKMDLALIKIDADGLTPAALGDSDTYSTGDQIYVVGNPLGNFVLSVSQGIISGVDRQANIDGNIMNLTQVDAAVNPGNSGGGLFDSRGRLIGIVNAKNTGIDVEGMGFAIPIDTVREVLDVMLQRTNLDLQL